MTTTEESTGPPNSRVAMREKHREICRALNLDADTEKRSLLSYEKTCDQFDLTGDPKHWMCCALYVACLQDLPAVGHPDHYIQGNGVNITNLLTQCNINIQEFFSKMKEWSEIRSLPERLRLAIDNLQHEFSVSITTYTVFNEYFPRVFNETNLMPDEPKRNKKSKPNRCSYNRLRDFAWVLFLTVKEQYKEHRHDLATAMDLCVCVLDLIYRNVVADGRMDLINPSILEEGGCSSLNGTTDVTEAAMKLNVAQLLCSEYPTSTESVAQTKRTVFLPTLSGMFNTKDLRGTHASPGPADDVRQFLGLVSVANFEDNLKSLHRRYERAILRCGMLDERIVLSSRTPPASLRQRWSVNIMGHPRTPLSIKSRGGGSVVPWAGGSSVDGIPLPGRGFPNDNNASGIFVVRGTLSHLMKKIQGHEPGYPRGTFHVLMRNCTPTPIGLVLDHVSRMRTRFVKKLIEKESWNEQIAEARFDTIEALYYQLQENIIPWEIKKRPTMPVSKVIYDMCSNQLFNETVIVCAAEIIFFLRQEKYNFPWILDVFDIEAFRFFQIIEVTVSSNSDIFTSDIVNHLRRVEEQLVDSLCWKSTSVLWDCMEKEKYQIPANKDVEQRFDIAGVTPLKSDSIPNPANGTRGNTGSTAGPSATVSATGTGRSVPHPDSAKKKLFVDAPETPTKVAATPGTPAGTASLPNTTSTTPPSSSVAPGGSTTPSKSASTAPEVAQGPGNGTNGCNDPSSISSLSSPQRDNNAPPTPETRRLNFFFRKMYHVAYTRLCNLCQNLGIEKDGIQKLIWTIFEFTITKRSKDLMRDRHLDQLIMCAIFVTIRIKKLENTFKQIMHCYLNQPQANSSIYRSVFIRHENTPPPEEKLDQPVARDEEAQNGTNGDQGSGGKRVKVSEMAGTSVQYDREVYGDIIKFYNDIYVVIVHHFALQYINTDVSQESLFLSPTPKTHVRNIQKSPRQVSSNLYVSTTNKISSLQNSPNVRTLTFPASPGQSPTVHEHNVPQNVRTKRDTCVRRLTEPAAFEPQTPPKMRRLNKIRQERRHDSTENEDKMDKHD